jgi:hypothetical protein
VHVETRTARFTKLLEVLGELLSLPVDLLVHERRGRTLFGWHGNSSFVREALCSLSGESEL